MALVVPLNVQAQVLTAIDEYRIGVAESDDVRDMYGDIRAIAVGITGDVFVADHLSTEFRRVRLSGEVMWTSGSRGSAPGEFFLMSAMAADDAGRLVVFDTQARRITRLSQSASPETAPTQGIRDAVRAEFDADIGYIVLESPPRPRNPDRSMIKIVDRDLQVVDSFGRYEELGLDTMRVARELLSVNPGYIEVDAANRILYVPYLYEGRLYRFARTQAGRYVAQVLVGAARGRSYTKYEVEARPAGSLVIQTWPKSMAAVVHTRSIGLVSMPDGSTWHFLLTGPTVDKQAYVEKFDAAGKYIGQVPVDFGVKVYARGGQATLEVRGYRDGLFYLIDDTEYPSVRVVRLVEKRQSR